MTAIKARMTVTVQFTQPEDIDLDLEAFQVWMYAFNGEPNAQPTEESLLDYLIFHDSLNPAEDDQLEGFSSRITGVQILPQEGS